MMFGSDDREKMSVGESLIVFVVLGAIIMGFIALVRFAFTKEGAILGGIILAIFLMVTGCNAVFTGSPQDGSHKATAQPSARSVQQHTPASDPNMGFRTVIRNGMICTTHNGVGGECTPIPR